MLIVLVTLSFSNIRWGEVEAVSEINMLYIGNSKTYYNIFPRMYRYLAISGEKNDAKLTAVVAGGRTLEQHATKLESIYAMGKLEHMHRQKNMCNRKIVIGTSFQMNIQPINRLLKKTGVISYCKNKLIMLKMRKKC